MVRANLMLQCIVTAWDRGHAFHHGDLEKSLALAERIYAIAMAKVPKAAKKATSK